MKIQYYINDGCWDCFSHSCDTNGYPVSTIGGVWDRVYRHFYRKHKGVIPKGMVIRHTCDNRKCINPNHLIIGTHADNVRDRVERDRSAKGMKNGRSKLNIEQVKFIKTDNTTPKMRLAKKFGVDPKVIRDIKNGKTWTSVTI